MQSHTQKCTHCAQLTSAFKGVEKGEMFSKNCKRYCYQMCISFKNMWVKFSIKSRNDIDVF